ncbi:thiamine diphosphokinase [Streptococcaceae bacterium ESL0729]|nr:thiamine diphosphokinase [Streptococcaceae bacterium ESL0729]
MKENKVLVVCSSTEINLVRDYKDYYTIGVERGCLDLIKAGLPINYAIGDFDSVSQEEFKLIKSYVRDLIKLPAEKDLLDGEEALIYAQTLRPDQLTLISQGPRFDMTLASLAFIRDYKLTLRNDHNYCFLLKKGMNVLHPLDGFKYLSFIALKESSLSIKDLAYTAQDLKLQPLSASAISNEFVPGQAGLVSLLEGQVIAIYTR